MVTATRVKVRILTQQEAYEEAAHAAEAERVLRCLEAEMAQQRSEV